VQHLTHGTGRFNASLGALTSAWGVAPPSRTSSPTGSWVVAGYRAAITALGIFGAAGLVLYASTMPEIGPKANPKNGLPQAGGLPQMGEAKR
jgi:hypothetical protein